jgi:hypothetical protein
MAAVFVSYLRSRSTTTTQQQKEALRLLLRRSMMPTGEVLRTTKLEYLTTAEAVDLLDAFST